MCLFNFAALFTFYFNAVNHHELTLESSLRVSLGAVESCSVYERNLEEKVQYNAVPDFHLSIIYTT